ncbi:MAG: DUF5666 domain-containing protein [Burkholderiaceae bacterium]
MNNLTPIRVMAVLIAGAALAACGGTDNNSAGGVSAQTKETTTGAITGFGSVIVEGVRYDDTGATVEDEVDATNPAPGTLADLKLGMQVELEAQDGRAKFIRIRPEVIGTVDAPTATGFIVLGQTVVVSDDTVYAGATALADIVAGDSVKVHGQRDENGNIIASRIKRKDPTSLRFYRVAGTVDSVDADSKTFMIRALTVRWNDSTRISPAADQIVVGARVAVFSDTDAQSNELPARAIRIRTMDDEPDSVRRSIGGMIQDYEVGTPTFRLRGVTVNFTPETKFENGTESDLADGRKILVRGTFSPRGENRRVIEATEIRFHHTHEHRNSLHGAISDYDSTDMSFMLRGVKVDASNDAVEYIGGDASLLGNGVNVKVIGSVDGDMVAAKIIKFVTAEHESEEEFESDRELQEGSIPDNEQPNLPGPSQPGSTPTTRR